MLKKINGPADEISVFIKDVQKPLRPNGDVSSGVRGINFSLSPSLYPSLTAQQCD